MAKSSCRLSRIRHCNRGLHLANLLLLLTTALIPFPTAVLATALQHGGPTDEAASVALYAAVGCLMCLSRFLLFHVLSINPHLLGSHVEPSFFPQERHHALFGVVLYALACVTGWALSPACTFWPSWLCQSLLRHYERGLVETRVALLRRLRDRRREGSYRARGPTNPHSA